MARGRACCSRRLHRILPLRRLHRRLPPRTPHEPRGQPAGAGGHAQLVAPPGPHLAGAHAAPGGGAPGADRGDRARRQRDRHARPRRGDHPRAAGGERLPHPRRRPPPRLHPLRRPGRRLGGVRRRPDGVAGPTGTARHPHQHACDRSRGDQRCSQSRRSGACRSWASMRPATRARRR